MEGFKIDILSAQLEEFAWLQLSAIKEGKSVGTATVYWLGMEGKAPELCNLFVHKAARRKGVAQALVTAAAKRLKRPFCLNVLQKSHAYWLYRKLGFTEVGPMQGKENFVWMLSPA